MRMQGVAPGEATPHTAVVFDETAADALATAQALSAAGFDTQVAESPPSTQTSSTVAAILGTPHADVAVWNVSPALSAYCAHLEQLLDRHSFHGVKLIVVTTNAPKVREYFGARCSGMEVLQKPVSTAVLLKAVWRIGP
ncbi:MAG TPA: hypothetical protein VMF13_06770 [Luteitalea sp.]|nr:hypothetical protein [Luteitalea sp.]